MFDKRRGPSITKKCFRVSSLCILLMCPIFAFGADYPTKPISLLCPYAAGGPVDLTGRVLAEIAKEILGQPVVVVNKPGGGGDHSSKRCCKGEARWVHVSHYVRRCVYTNSTNARGCL